MALHARTARQPQDRAPKRQLSVRTMLLVLALVPCLALVALGGMDSNHLYGDWRTVHDRNDEGKRFGTPLVTVFFNLQEERRLSAAVLADPRADRSDLTRQRELTDRSVRNLVAVGAAPSALDEPFQEVTRGLKKLPVYRDSVDRRSTYQQQTFDAYTDVIASSMQLFEDFSNVGFGETAVLTRPALDAQWGQEMISREDAIITAGTASGRLTGEQRFQIAGLIGSQQHIYSDKVVPELPDTRAETYRAVLTSADWKRKTEVEQSILNAEGTGADDRTAVSAALGRKWRQGITGITPQLLRASDEYSEDLVAATEDELDGLMTHMIVNSAVSAAAVALMLVLSLRLTGTLRRRIFGLRAEALELQERLPDIVERLRKGEKVDTDAELPEIRHGDDELGQLGQALNEARGSALETAVREVELYRGFERLLQRIARRTQLLIGMQLKRLGEMQRRHEDPEVLEGLFDLDHLAARLRRYEENLVILGSGTPQRRWRRPVLLLDIMRSAQGEVQDYRRIRIDSDGETWLSERAVGPMVHLLAELMENAVSFSRPPTPVEVTASRVGRGVAIEIEDRGMGMDPEQYAEANALMAAPPRMDVMSRADDARLGLYVVARLAANLGLGVELRPSSFGGTRVVVLVPAELISAGRPRLAEAARGEPVPGGQPVSGGPVPSPATPAAPPGTLPNRLALRGATVRPGPRTAPPTADTEPAQPAHGRPVPGGQPVSGGPVPSPASPTSSPGTLPNRLALRGATTRPGARPHAGPGGAAGNTGRTGDNTGDQEAYERPLIGPWAAPSVAATRPAQASVQTSVQASAQASSASPNPLPRRVRQASLAAELREAPPSYDTEPAHTGPATGAQPLPRRTGARAGATVGAFQRQSRAARLRPDADQQPGHQPTNPSPGPARARKEDGR
ncbi:nitrate- and nitrite sensing domain-containing protein [Streptomyces sp. WI04-05B]|uniref:sensor histidine kinase n=1 Tax=Streptomyces TaxID=1883 RepID=UPI0029B313D8|nr:MULTISPECIES: nitrate- and nitrite sensing domain-containing protein [unclassified Streptomyces]MDX2543879.1 nitrate- and nitrite sensing domain-containing protein [Streptomyces sp. WI04-05B]MDX2582031.1 nitrate- and nitrite sensing domain-containing protein [Streptomyces sp. WI04-05A]MDX3752443.1 nitrate- and nitrite sensing domain-containing protein [Streptomyces sp. AK08-02]